MRKPILSSLVLIILGTTLLLTNLGYFDNNLLNSFQYWPVILIVIGLEIILTRHGSPKLLVAGVIIVFVLPFFLQGKSLPFNISGFSLPSLNFLNGGINSTGSVPLEKKLGTLIGANINLDLSSGDLKINSLENGSPILLKGTLGYNRINKEPQVTYDPKDGTAKLDIKAGSQTLPISISASSWDLSLSRAVPYDISVKSSSGNSTIDLANLKVNSLNLDLGKTTSTLNLNKAGSIKVTVVATEGTITISVPKEAAAKVEVPSDSSFDIANRFIQTDHGYLTDRFDQSSDKIEIKATLGKAKLIVN